MVNYSQNDEQEKILAFFKGKRFGQFLEIGGFDGVTFSNTRALLELDWFGHIYEPDPFNLCKLVNSVTAFKDQVEIIGAAVGFAQDLTRLHMDLTDDRGWASTLEPFPKSVLLERQVIYRVPVVGIKDVMNRIQRPDFISIDAEHEDWNILLGMGTPNCDLICIEPTDNRQREEMRSYLSARGFANYHETPENLLMRRLTNSPPAL